MSRETIDKLEQLAQLNREGIITKEELETEKKKLFEKGKKAAPKLEADAEKSRSTNANDSVKSTEKPNYSKTIIIGLCFLFATLILGAVIYFYGNHWTGLGVNNDSDSVAVVEEEFNIDPIEDKIKMSLDSKESFSIGDSAFKELIISTYTPEYYEKMLSTFPEFKNVVMKDGCYWAESGTVSISMEGKKYNYAWLKYNPQNKNIETSMVIDWRKIDINGVPAPRRTDGWKEYEYYKLYNLASNKNIDKTDFKLCIDTEGFFTYYTDLVDISKPGTGMNIRDNIFGRTFQISIITELHGENAMIELDHRPNTAYDVVYNTSLLYLFMCLPDYSIVLQDSNGVNYEINNPQNIENAANLKWEYYGYIGTPY